MKTLLGFLSILLAVSANAAPEKGGKEGGGGEVLKFEFIAMGQEVLAKLDATGFNYRLPIPPYWVDLQALRRALQDTEVQFTEEKLLCEDGGECTALNFPAEKRIQVNRPRWVEALPLKIERMGIVLHEYLGVLGVDDRAYRVSQVFTTILKDPKAYPQLVDKWDTPESQLRDGIHQNSAVIVGRALAAGANPNSNAGLSPIQDAAGTESNGASREMVMQALVDAGADVTVLDGRGRNILRVALETAGSQSDYETDGTVQYLATNFPRLILANPDLDFELTPIQYAVMHEIGPFSLKDLNVGILVDAGGQAAAQAALAIGGATSVKALENLVSHGADINLETDYLRYENRRPLSAVKSKYRETAIVYYSRSRNNLPMIDDLDAIIDTLLKSGADTRYVSPAGDNALSAAWQKCDIVLCDRYVRMGLSPPKKGQLNMACPARHGRADLIRFAKTYGSDPNDRTAWVSLGWNDKWVAAPAYFASNDIHALNAMIAAGADVKLRDDAGRTMLMREAHGGGKDMLEALLKAGAEKGAKDPKGNRAVDYYDRASGKSWWKLWRDPIHKMLKP